MPIWRQNALDAHTWNILLEPPLIRWGNLMEQDVIYWLDTMASESKD